MSDENNKNDAPLEVFTQDTPTPEEQAEYERVKARHIEYAAELHAVTEKYIKEAHYGFAHRTMALVFTWENGDEGVDAPVRAFIVSHPDQFLTGSSPGRIYRFSHKMLALLQQASVEAQEIQQATGNAVPKTSGVIH